MGARAGSAARTYDFLEKEESREMGKNLEEVVLSLVGPPNSFTLCAAIHFITQTSIGREDTISYFAGTGSRHGAIPGILAA